MGKMHMKAKRILAAAVLSGGLEAAGAGAQWIWFPGDYGLWWGN